MKFKKDDHIVEVTDPNTFNVFERAGFVPMEEEVICITEYSEEEKAELLKKAKGLGIKSAHMMSTDTLKKKIAELS